MRLFFTSISQNVWRAYVKLLRIGKPEHFINTMFIRIISRLIWSSNIFFLQLKQTSMHFLWNIILVIDVTQIHHTFWAISRNRMVFRVKRNQKWEIPEQLTNFTDFYPKHHQLKIPSNEESGRLTTSIG